MFFFAKNHFPTQNLLSDAETAENGGEDLLGGYLASDGAQMIERITNVDRQQVGRQPTDSTRQRDDRAALKSSR